VGKIVPKARDQVQFKYKPQFGVIVVCKDEAEQERVYDALRRKHKRCRVVTT